MYIYDIRYTIYDTIYESLKKKLWIKGHWQSSHPGDEADFFTLYYTYPVLIKNLSFLDSLEIENPKIDPKSHLV